VKALRVLWAVLAGTCVMLLMLAVEAAEWLLDLIRQE